MRTMNTRYKILTEIILDLLVLFSSILDSDMKMDCLRDWEREPQETDKFFAYSPNNIFKFSNTFLVFSS